MKISYVVVDSQGVPLISSGDVECPVWMHSTAKPIQLLPFLDRGLDRKYSLTPEEVVLLASSHLAQPQHVDTLLSVFRKAELKEQMLILPPSAPQGIKSYNNYEKITMGFGLGDVFLRKTKPDSLSSFHSYQRSRWKHRLFFVRLHCV